MIRIIDVATGKESTREYNAEELAVINSPENVKARANDALLVQIAELEAQITPRMMRDYILRPNVPAKAGKTQAQFIADIDGQIAALRAQIQP